MLQDTDERTPRPPSIEHRADRREEGVVDTLTVSNPKRLNVLTGALIDDLRNAIESYGRARECRALLLRGAGAAAWIGGIDSNELAAADPESAVAMVGRLGELCLAIRDAPVPVIAVIRGYCLGPGLEIAASCDMRIAANDASFGLSEIYAGMPAVAGGALLPRLIGMGRTRQLALTGCTIDSRTARDWGLLEGVSPPGPALDALVESHVADILMADRRAVGLQKRLCRAWEERSLRESLELGLKAFARAVDDGSGTHL